jgi:hypothetical protein
VRRVAKRAARAWTRPTAGLRVLPDHLIVGAQRAGTTVCSSRRCWAPSGFGTVLPTIPA